MRSSADPILHLVHPRPIPWKSLITPIAQELKATIVPYVEWLTALEIVAERNAEAARENPALRLLDFFRSSAPAKTRTPLGLYQLETKKAVDASETLASMPELGEADVKRWVTAWRRRNTGARIWAVSHTSCDQTGRDKALHGAYA